MLHHLLHFLILQECDRVVDSFPTAPERREEETLHKNGRRKLSYVKERAKTNHLIIIIKDLPDHHPENMVVAVERSQSTEMKREHWEGGGVEEDGTNQFSTAKEWAVRSTHQSSSTSSSFFDPFIITSPIHSYSSRPSIVLLLLLLMVVMVRIEKDGEEEELSGMKGEGGEGEDY
uniref:Uncharacterized protein n=1 Tax=Globodera rostochiensis TaxID=31243 RepID=A0A914I9A3_GLORO